MGCRQPAPACSLSVQGQGSRGSGPPIASRGFREMESRASAGPRSQAPGQQKAGASYIPSQGKGGAWLGLAWPAPACQSRHAATCIHAAKALFAGQTWERSFTEIARREHRRTTCASAATRGESSGMSTPLPKESPASSAEDSRGPARLRRPGRKDGLVSLDEFNVLDVAEILDQDSRPTFVIDLDPDDNVIPSLIGLTPIFCNSALRLHERLSDVIAGNRGEVEPNTGATYQDFRSWATGVTQHDDSKDCFPLSFLYADMLWTGSTVRKRWRLISGNLWNPGIPVRELTLSWGTKPRQEFDKSSAKPSVVGTVESLASTAVTTRGSSKLHQQMPRRGTTTSYSNSTGGTGDSSQSKKLVLSAPAKACPDWTAARPRGTVSEHIAIARAVRWETTPLGSMDKWSPEFRQLANVVMQHPYPAAIFWGDELTMLYNEAYANEAAGHKHPGLMGTGFSGPFSEVWDGISDIFAECARTGSNSRREDDYMALYRGSFLEETFWSWSLTPLYGQTKNILGFYNSAFETTQSVISQRRMQTVNRVGSLVSGAKSIKQFWKLLLEALEGNHFEIPFALVYSVGDTEDNDQSSTSSGSTLSVKSCFYEGSIGIPEGHAAAPHQLDLKRSREGFVPAFREAMRTREPSLLHTRDGSLPESLLEGITWRGFGEPCDKAVIFPVRPTNGETVLAFLVLGVNPRRSYDESYKAFTSILNRQLATSLASFMLFEEEVRRSKDAAEAAALQTEHLSQELALQTNRFRRMTELSPIGMVLFDPDGSLRECNDRYYEMTGHPRDVTHEMSWMDQIEESSRKLSQEGWEKMIVEHQPWTAELQLKRILVKPVDLHDKDIDYWVLITAQPEFSTDGSVRAIMGSITDISHLKWAQGLQNLRLQEAEETRRQQNEFIDITSHEMRNPLSAILQCADDILTTLSHHRMPGQPPSLRDIEDCLEAAHTISICVQHQKSIVDDVLTVSKLDSNLLVITPVVARPTEVVERAVKMFESELQAKDIRMVYETQPSLQELTVEWVAFDPSRVLQILINLLTNAIKFTAASTTRNITVSVGASLDPPLMATTPNFQYIPAKTVNPHVVAGEEWGKEEVLYLRFKVHDTGCGLTSDEIKLLFTRFSQASPRTHAQYGGSGLGLFISRQLAELHGGRIGVASKAGVGSSFGFFVAARRALPPASNASVNIAANVSRELGVQSSLTLRLSPQHQDLAPPSPVGDLVATKTVAKFDPKDLAVLVVEDNLVNQTVLVRQLKKHGIDVNAANDGIEALAFLDGTEFRKVGGKRLSVILMDLEMPNMDGLTCVREIRQMEEEGAIDGHVPVIAVTANVREEQISVARRSGMDDVVSKPFRIPDLLKKIEALLAAISNGATTPKVLSDL
ncbi:histidine kinase hhk13p [Seiridium cupressi]